MCETYKRCCASGVESYIHAHRCLIVHGVYCTDGWVGGWAPSLVPVTRAMAASRLCLWRCLAVVVTVAVAVAVAVAVTRGAPR